MDFDKNVDHLNQTALPNYGISPRTSGLQLIFTDETDYVEPYNIDDFKEFARIDFDTDANLIEIFLKSARITIENYLQRSLGIRKIRLTALSLPKNFKLPWGPVEGLTVDMGIQPYTLVGDILKEGGTDVTVNYITNASLANDSIKIAIYKQALEFYENRGAYFDGQVTNEVRMILYPYKNIHFL